jgi:large subunit ribosomal protein L20
MTRARSGPAHRRRHKKVLKRAKGYVAGRRRLYKVAHETLLRAGNYAYRDRRNRKRDMRRLWIVRINAACRLRGLPYNQFLHGLKLAQVALDRKSLSELAIRDEAVFDALVDLARRHLSSTVVPTPS